MVMLPLVSEVTVGEGLVLLNAIQWFTASYRGEDTARLIWNFVSQYDINGLR